MATKVDDIHSTLNGDLNIKIDEIHRLMTTFRELDSSPRLPPAYPESSYSRKSTSEQAVRPKRDEVKPLSVNTSKDSTSSYYTYSMEKISNSLDVHDDSNGLQGDNDSALRAESWYERPESWLTTLDTSREVKEEGTLPQYEKYRSPTSNRHSLPSPVSSTSVSRTHSDSSRKASQATLSMLPPAALSNEKIPTDKDSTEKIPVKDAKKDYDLLIPPESDLSFAMQLKVATTEAEQAQFEKDLFGNTAVLCEA
jgi:hypothetical protein